MAFSPHYSGDSYIPVFENLSQSLPRNFERFHNQRRPENSTHSSDTRVPWKKEGTVYCGVIGLHEEIDEFHKMMRATAREQKVRLKVVEHITRTVHSLWPQAQVEVFGSFRTSLYLPSSDIDMVIIGEWQNVPLSTLSQALERNGVLKSDINIIANATVPIIRLVHSPSNIKVDISFNMTNGVKSAKMIKKFVREHPPLGPLAMVLKQFLVTRGLNEVYEGGMSSYCLTLLILSFLQGYHKPKCEPSVNIGTLLIEFFEHYGVNFNYEKVSIHFQNGGHYQPRHAQGNLLSVEDPLVGGHDVAKGTYLMHLLKMSFQNAFYTLSKAVSESALAQAPVPSFLNLILTVDEEVLRSRQVMESNAPKIIRTLSRLLEEGSSSSFLSETPISTKKSPKMLFTRKQRKKMNARR